MMVATAALAIPITGSAGMYQSLGSACNNESACIKAKVMDEVYQSVRANYLTNDRRPFDDRIQDVARAACYNYKGLYKHSEFASIYSEQECVNYVESTVAEFDAKLKKREGDEEQQRNQKEAQEQQIKVVEQQKTAALEADLRAGRVKPKNIGQAAIAYNAEIGVDLASAPKIRPDGKLYALPGKIAIADDSPEFLAQISLGEQNDALFRMTGRSSEIDGRYFYVKIPKVLQAYYFDQAKIEHGFDLVGRYVANTKYKTIAGQQKSAPVFEAVYFVMRK